MEFDSFRGFQVEVQPSAQGAWPPRRNAIDFHAPTNGVPKDHWHQGMNTKTVCMRPNHCFGIFFHVKGDYPSVNATLGVALTLCEYPAEAVEMPETPTHTLLPHELRAKGPELTVLITWPGYFHLKFKRPIYLDTTTGDLARQVSRIFQEFYERHWPDFKGPGIRLGPSFMTFDRLRLRAIFWDGRYWNIETSYVYEKETVWNFR